MKKKRAKKPRAKKICGAKLRGKNKVCQKAPMHNGRCRLHGGSTPSGPDNPNFKHGRYASAFQGKLAEKFEQSVQDDKPMDLQRELAVLRTLNEQVIEQASALKKLRMADVGNIATITTAVINAASKIAKMRNDEAMTMAEVRFIQTRMIQILEKYVPDPDRRRAFVEELNGLIPQRLDAGSEQPAELPAPAIQAKQTA
jgi:hypothetical protein